VVKANKMMVLKPYNLDFVKEWILFRKHQKNAVIINSKIIDDYIWVK